MNGFRGSVEGRISKFSGLLLRCHHFIKKVSRQATNLSKTQLYLLKTLRSDKNSIILNCDKNLGPTIIERERYTELILKEHLLNSKNYKRHNENQSFLIILNLKESLLDTIEDYKDCLCDFELEYFHDQINPQCRKPQFLWYAKGSQASQFII